MIRSLTTAQARTLLYEWRFWARDKQQTPTGDWLVWLILAGRGFGKTRTGAEFVRQQVEAGNAQRIALVGRTSADVRDTMIEGESGLLAVCPPWNRPHYEPSKRRLTWPNGARATAFSGDKPDQLRGPSHDLAWADELAAWRFADAWDQLQFGLRIGLRPRVVVTTTPRPTPIIRSLVDDDPTAHVTRGHTMENRANLAPSALRQLMTKYQGTRLGRQELAAEILDDNPGAYWKRDNIEAHRVTKAPTLARIVVAVDPAVTSSSDADETGIIAGAVGLDGHGYVLDDRSLQDTPAKWAAAAVTTYHTLEADRLVAEVNNGGDLVEATIRTVDPTVSYKAVRASRGKATRAEPVAALYEQGRVHHVGTFPELEDQLCQWSPDSGQRSPDRLDALVWALSELMLKPERSYKPL